MLDGNNLEGEAPERARHLRAELQKENYESGKKFKEDKKSSVPKNSKKEDRASSKDKADKKAKKPKSSKQFDKDKAKKKKDKKEKKKDGLGTGDGSSTTETTTSD